MTEGKRFRNKLCGQTEFLSDLAPPGCYRGRIIRAEIAHGKIKSISSPDIERKDIYCVSAKTIGAANIVDMIDGPFTLLADEEILYFSQPVLLVCAKDPNKINWFVKNTSIEYETKESVKKFSQAPDNSKIQREFTNGNAKGSMAAAAHVTNINFQAPTLVPYYSDNDGAYAYYEAGKYIIYTPTQWPYHVRRLVSGALGIPASRIDIRPTGISRSYNSRLWYSSLLAAYTALLSRATGEAVYLEITPTERIRTFPEESRMRISAEASFDDTLKLTGLSGTIHFNIGAFPVLSREIIDRACLGLSNVYMTRNVHFSGQTAVTNTPPAGTFPGMGTAQTILAAEKLLIETERILNCDPVELRLKNCITPGHNSVTNGKFTTPPVIKPLLEGVIAAADFRRKYAASKINRQKASSQLHRAYIQHGIGLSSGYQGNGFINKPDYSSYSVQLELDSKSKLTIRTSAVLDNPGLYNIWKESAGEILGISSNNISVNNEHSINTPNSGPSVFSRNIVDIHKLVIQCSNAIKKKRFRSALPIKVQRSVKKSSAGNWNSEDFSGFPFNSISWAACVAEVMYEPLTGIITLGKILMHIDAGLILNEKSARNEIEAGILHASEWVLQNVLPAERNKETTEESLFSVPGIYHQPQIDIQFMNSNQKVQPKGIGELAINTVPAAILHAVYSATGIHFDNLPVTPAALHKRTQKATETEVSS